MCGIAGIFGWDDLNASQGALLKMGAAMAHRGPDADGFHVAEKVALGHKRLSIIDLSEAGNQPMHSPDGRYTLIINGEIYNYLELKPQLEDYPYKGNSDTEVVLAAWIKWGPECLKRFNGMFALAVWDHQEQTAFLARDRMGIKPLYMAQISEKLVIASEVRAILESGIVPRKLNRQCLVEFLNYQTVHAPNTMIEGISMLGAGEVATFKAGQLSQKPFWSPTADANLEAQGQSPKVIRSRVRDLLASAVERRMMADVPLGAFLSGGIDSSAIVGLMAQASTQAVDTFSVVFSEKEFDESTWSDMVAKKFTTQHHPILLKPQDFLDELPKALAAMDHPSGDGINSYVVSKVTREQGITVALSGLGGDELFAGYPVFLQLPQIMQKQLLWAVPNGLRQLAAGISSTVPGGRRGEKLAALLRLKGGRFQDIYPVFRTVFDPKGMAGILRDAPLDWNAIQHFVDANEKAFEPLDLLSKISVSEISTYTQNVLLRDTDQMSMAHALEVRVPFFDHTLVEYVLGIPDKVKQPHFPKQLLVESLGDMLPHEVVHRKKMGFVFPWDHWLKNELRSFVEKRLENLGKRSFIQPGKPMHLYHDFLSGKGSSLWLHIWLLVMLEDWMEKIGIEE